MLKKVVFGGLLAGAALFAAYVWVPQLQTTGGTWPQAPQEFVKDSHRSELYHRQMTKTLRATFVQHLKNMDYERLATVLHPDFAGRLPAEQDLQETHIEDQIRIHPFKMAPQTQLNLDAIAFVNAIKQKLQHATMIDRASWLPFTSLSHASAETGPHFVQAHMMLGFRHQNGAREELHWTVDAELMMPNVKEVSLLKFAVSDGYEVFTELPAFSEVSSEIGFNYQSDYSLPGETRSGSLSALDFNQDGYWDILASVDSMPNILFLNDGHSGFNRVDLPFAEPKNSETRFYLWLDLDNDGQEELLSTHTSLREGNEMGLRVYRRGKTGKSFQPHDDIFTFENIGHFGNPIFRNITACDVDGDLDLDILFGGWGYRDFSRTSFLDSVGTFNVLFINQGNLKFTEEALSRGVTAKRLTFVTECFDFDADGDVDILYGNDLARNDYYENDGKGFFKLDASHPLNQSVGFTMGASISDFDNTGHYALYLANMYSHAGHRIRSLEDSLSAENEDLLMKLANGNTLYELRDGSWNESAANRNIHNGDWSWGSIFFDADNDMDKDLYVLNGYVSGNDPTAPDH